MKLASITNFLLGFICFFNKNIILIDTNKILPINTGSRTMDHFEQYGLLLMLSFVRIIKIFVEINAQLRSIFMFMLKNDNLQPMAMCRYRIATVPYQSSVSNFEYSKIRFPLLLQPNKKINIPESITVSPLPLKHTSTEMIARIAFEWAR